MPTIKRKRPPKHILIPDTNILWHEKKDKCVAPAFSKFWEDYGAKYEIELVLPEVVLGELLYQHTTSALTTLERINTQFENLSSFASRDYKHRVNSKRVRHDVEAKFASWISSLSAAIVKTPVDQIDWSKIIEDAIWRRPPFTEDKDKKNEKGFRDALILQTVCFIADSREMDIAFVSNDSLLIAATKERLREKKQCSFYETLDEFSSYLRLLDEKLTNEFVQAIQRRARARFFAQNDPSCLYRRETITRKIRDQFASEFVFPGPTRVLSQALQGVLSGGSFSKWEEASAEGIWIKKPSFIELQGESDFVWDSRVTFVQLFRYVGPSGGGLLGSMLISEQENLRKLEFKVLWRARVGKDAKFRKIELIDIALAERKFEPASEEDKERYGVAPITE